MFSRCGLHIKVFDKEKQFYYFLKLNFHLQKCYKSVMYMEFFAVYFYLEELSSQIFYSWIELLSSRVNYWWTQRWYASISFSETLPSTSSNFLFKILVGTLSRIPQISILVLRPYHFNELWSFSSDITLLSKSLTFFLVC